MHRTTAFQATFRGGLHRARVNIEQSSLLIVSDRVQALNAAVNSVVFHRKQLEHYIMRNPAYEFSLTPVSVESNSPLVVRLAAEAADSADVGPMAAVPGALADLAVEAMKPESLQVSMVENGGEISACSKIPLNVGVYAGKSPLSGRIGFRLLDGDFPVGIGTSSATVGHALSFGEADAAITIADSVSLADAAATAVCNAVKGDDAEASVQAGLEAADRIYKLRAALIIRGRYVGKCGRLPKLLMIDGELSEMFEAGEMVTL